MGRPGPRSALLSWYDEHRRDLPWRRKRGEPVGPRGRPAIDPYAVLVSEVMLQQTTVFAVIPYFRRWMERFPDLERLAEAGDDEVMGLWEGLGYYRRARNLQQAAREAMARYGGTLPEGTAELRSLPGIGAYTAGAVASIAFGRREPALDANASRVLSRLFGASTGRGHRTFRTWGAVERHLTRAARLLLPSDRPGDFNQALMDLGSSLCSPKAPRCLACPLAPWCRTRRLGLADAIPGPRPSKPVESFAMAVGLAVHQGRVLLIRRPSGGPFAGMWDFPAVRAGRIPPGNTPGSQGKTCSQSGVRVPSRGTGRRGARAALETYIRERTGTEVTAGRKKGEVPQAYSRFRVTLKVYPCEVARKGRRRTGRWVALTDLGKVALPKASRTIARELLQAVRGRKARAEGPRLPTTAPRPRSRPRPP